MKTHDILISLTLGLALPSLGACHRIQPCASCEEEKGDDEEDDDAISDLPVSDLPCGGADLQNDDLNCGTCGNECPSVQHAGTDYEVGGCIEGMCGGPRWTYAILPDPPDTITCNEVCGEYGCVEAGCGAGKTGWVCGIVGDFGEQCTYPETYATADISSCDEPAPWVEDFWDPLVHPRLNCCCNP